MNASSLFAIVFMAAFSFGQFAYADEPDAKASAFAKFYSDTCLKHLPDLQSLHSRLSANVPKFPPTQAALFLKGNEGDAWPVPSREHNGNFVVALFAKKDFCVLYGRRASPKDVEKLFVQLVEKAPPPFISTRKDDAWTEASPNGRGHTISYVWSLPNAKRSFLFMLTTADSDNAAVQAFASANIMSE